MVSTLLPPHPKEKDLEETGKMKLNFEFGWFYEHASLVQK
jgi:hypothetical protein